MLTEVFDLMKLDRHVEMDVDLLYKFATALFLHIYTTWICERTSECQEYQRPEIKILIRDY